MFGVRQRNVLDDRALGLEDSDGFADGQFDFGVEAFAEKFAHDPDPEVLGGVVEVGQVVGNEFVDAGGVLRVVAGHYAEHQGGVGDVVGKRAGLVQRTGEGDQAVSADPAIGGLEADDPAERGGLADRAAGVGPEGDGREVGGDGGGRTARRAAGNPLEVPGVAGRSVVAVLGGRAHRELVHVRFADQDRVGLAKFADDRGVVRRAEVFQHPRPAGRRLPLGAEDILDRDRDPGERAEPVAPGASGVDRAGVVEHPIGIAVQESVDLTVEAVDPVEVGADGFLGRDRLGRQGLAELEGGGRGRVHARAAGGFGGIGTRRSGRLGSILSRAKT